MFSSDPLFNRVGSLSFLLLMILCMPLSTQGQTANQCDLPASIAHLDYNNVNASVQNSGSLFNWDGYEVPKADSISSIFSANLWVGGIVDDQVRGSFGVHSFGSFRPGPLDDQGLPPQDCSEYDRLYKVSVDDIIAFENNQADLNPDLLDWPVDLGAPVIDGDGILGNYNLAGGDRPKILGHQNIWWLMNDSAGFSRRPLGLEVRTTAFSMRSFDHINNTTFYKYEIKNRSNKRIDDFYAALWADPDIGYYYDDSVASDTLLGLGYVYNRVEFDTGGYGDKPPAVGFDIVDSPLADSDSVDNDFDGLIDEEGEKMNMTNFHVHNKNSGWYNDLPRDDKQAYNYMKSILQDGSPVTKGYAGRDYSDTPTKYMYTGNPPNFWTYENADNQGNSNLASFWLINSIGPFDLEPDESISFTIAILWARGQDRLDSVRFLKEASASVQAGIDAGIHEDPSYLSLYEPQPQSQETISSPMGVGIPYPNPSTGRFNLSYIVNRSSQVEISVFDIHGRLVKDLIKGQREVGERTLSLDLSDQIPGRYFVRYQIAGAVKHFPITLMPR